MATLTWDATGSRYYETGIKKCALYLVESAGTYGNGVAWNGVAAISESPSGAEASPIYADDIKYLNLYSVEEFSATLEAYGYPPEFEECDGSASLVAGLSIGQQTRKGFGLTYRTVVGNDTDGEGKGYKIHFIYGCKASPSEKAYQTINDSPEPISFSWEITTTPVEVSGFKPTATAVVDSLRTDATALADLENYIYGTATTPAKLPLPDEIKELLGTGMHLTLFDFDATHANSAVTVNVRNKATSGTVTATVASGTDTSGTAIGASDLAKVTATVSGTAVTITNADAGGSTETVVEGTYNITITDGTTSKTFVYNYTRT